MEGKEELMGSKEGRNSKERRKEIVEERIN